MSPISGVESTKTQRSGAVFMHCIRTLGERSMAALSGQPFAQRSDHWLQVEAVLRHHPYGPASFLDGLCGNGADRSNDDPVHRHIKCGRRGKFPRDLLKPTHLRRAGKRDQIDGSRAGARSSSC